MTYSYKAELEAQYRKALSRAVALRAERDDLAARRRTFTTSYDHVERSAAVSSLLASTERELGELRHKLGLPEPRPPIKIPPAAESRAELARIQARQAARAKVAPTVRRAPGQYLTKDLAAYKPEFD
jgi:hypothetical protein